MSVGPPLPPVVDPLRVVYRQRPGSPTAGARRRPRLRVSRDPLARGKPPPLPPAHTCAHAHTHTHTHTHMRTRAQALNPPARGGSLRRGRDRSACRPAWSNRARPIERDRSRHPARPRAGSGHGLIEQGRPVRPRRINGSRRRCGDGNGDFGSRARRPRADSHPGETGRLVPGPSRSAVHGEHAGQCSPRAERSETRDPLGRTGRTAAHQPETDRIETSVHAHLADSDRLEMIQETWTTRGFLSESENF